MMIGTPRFPKQKVIIREIIPLLLIHPWMILISLLSDYMDYISRISDMEQKFKAIEDEDVKDEEALYYAEVSLRIEKKC